MGVDLVYHVPANADLATVAEARTAMDAVAMEIHRQWEEARERTVHRPGARAQPPVDPSNHRAGRVTSDHA